MACVYKLTRTDGLEYIGITKNLKKRLWYHRRSPRFKQYKLRSYVVLYDGSYEDCDRLEEQFIEKYDTFKNGLNMTKQGKGRTPTDKFNTLGYKFSAESRSKMSKKSKARVRTKGHKHSATTKAKWSKLRKGKAWGPIKICPERLIKEWNEFNPTLLEMQTILSLVTRNDGKTYFKNGRVFSYNSGKLSLFKKVKSKEYGVTPEAIKRVILNAK